MDSMNFLLDLIALGCGVYCLYTWIKLPIDKKLFKNGLLVPKEKKVSDCSDEAAYIAYIGPKLGVLAIVTTLYGILFTLNDNLPSQIVPYPWNFIPLAIVMAAIVWYAICNSKANKLYFGM